MNVSPLEFPKNLYTNTNRLEAQMASWLESYFVENYFTNRTFSYL